MTLRQISLKSVIRGRPLIMSTKRGEGVWKSLTVVDRGEGGSVEVDVNNFFSTESNRPLKKGHRSSNV